MSIWTIIIFLISSLLLFYCSPVLLSETDPNYVKLNILLCNKEDLTTESNQGNSISISDIYNALCHLSAEDQGVLLSVFKLPEICCILKDFKTYNQYTNELIKNANQYLQVSKALSNLYKVSQKLTEEVENYNWLETMEKVYDNLSKESQKEFIENMAQKQDFFKDAYDVIIGKMNQAVKEQGEDVSKE